MRHLNQLREEWLNASSDLTFESWLAGQLQAAEGNRDHYFQRMTYAGALLQKLVNRLENRGMGHIVDMATDDYLKKGYIGPDDLPTGKPFTFADLRENMLLWSEDRTFFWLVKERRESHWLILGYKWGPYDKPMRDMLYANANMARWVPLSEAEAFACPTFGRWLPWSELYPEAWGKWLNDPVVQMERGSGGFATALSYYGIKLRTEP